MTPRALSDATTDVSTPGLEHAVAAVGDLAGLVRAHVVDAGATGSSAESAAPDLLLAWARRASGIGTELQDVIVTTSRSHHLLRGFEDEAGNVSFVYLEVDRERGNLAVARRRLARLMHPTATPAAPPRDRRPATVPVPGRDAVVLPTTNAPAAPEPLQAHAGPRTSSAPAPLDRGATPALAMLPSPQAPPAPPSPRRGRDTALVPRDRPAEPAAAPSTREPAEPASVLAIASPTVGALQVPVPRAPRRVPVWRPSALIDPPTVPPPPHPDAMAAPGLPDGPPSTAPPPGGSTQDERVSVPGGVPPPEPHPDGPDPRGDELPALPLRRADASAPSAPESGPDPGTLRRLLIGLRRMA